MLRPGVTQEWVDEGELPRERTKNRRWRRPYDVLAEATRKEVVRQVFRVCASKLASDESLDHQHMGAMYHEGEANVATKEAKENRIDASPAIRWRRPCIRVVVCLSIDQGELLGGHSGVEADSRKERGSDDESNGAQLPKNKASVRKEVDLEEHHSAIEAYLSIANKGMQMQGNG
ncbi:hypothetical protein B296_00024814 [Ensete ventricosum]|uniref:Uncharacterized protein n=1 Tax=Ensete ventricosum TaxID=4639 RepID=A0A426YLJ1_ENSVE|nr:hypothetical protein B296_00024814 [Ensete ventricosum]